MTRTLRAAAISSIVLAVGVSAAAQQASTSTTVVPRTQGFSVALVLGDMQSGAKEDNVPTAARKALADMKDFLPFKGYRLLDAQWTLCCGHSPIVSRLRGPDDQEYDLQLSASGIDTRGGLSVRFLLRDPAVQASQAGEVESLTQQKLAAEAQLADLRTKYNDNHPSVVRSRNQIANLTQRINELHRTDDLRRRGVMAGGRGGTIIDASFRMDVGETVVVGTSRVKGGDKALIALLTAVPQRSSATR
jgi:hypothetical protein